MEIKILVKEHQKSDLENFTKECEKQGFKITREGGGRLPSFSGYYAELKGERWQKADTGDSNCTIDSVSVSLLEEAGKLVGNPGTNISGSCDVACMEWQERYERWRNER